MNSKQTTMLLLGAAVVVGVLYAVYRKKEDDTPPQRVTDTAKGDLVTSPIQESRVAFLTNPLRVAVDAVVSNATRVTKYVVGSLASAQSGDKLARQGNTQSAISAFLAPLRPDYAAKVEPSLPNAKPAEVSRAGNSFQFN